MMGEEKPVTMVMASKYCIIFCVVYLLVLFYSKQYLETAKNVAHLSRQNGSRENGSRQNGSRGTGNIPM